MSDPGQGVPRKTRKPRSVLHLLREREGAHGRAAAAVSDQVLQWSMGRWMRAPTNVSSYCRILHAKSTIALAFSGDGELFASTHGDHTVKVFHCADWAHECTLRGHDRTPWTVKFHPHSRWILATGSLDQTVRVWDITSRTCLRMHDFQFVVSCISFHSSGELLAVTAGKRISLWLWRQSTTSGTTRAGSGEGGGSGEAAAMQFGGEGEEVGSEEDARLGPLQAAANGMHLSSAPAVTVMLEGQQPQRCVAFKRSATHELLFVAETNALPPPRLPGHLVGDAQQMVPPFTVQLWLWMLDPQLEAVVGLECDTSSALLKVAQCVMYSDAGFDVSQCGRFLALCELDPQVGYRLRTLSLQRQSLGVQLQTVALPNCPYVTSVQFSPLTTAVLIGYGRCQVPPQQAAPQYAVLRCIQFRGDRQEDMSTEEVELFAIDSTDESNVALFHPHAASCALLGFLYATKDGRIRAFKHQPA